MSWRAARSTWLCRWRQYHPGSGALVITAAALATCAGLVTCERATQTAQFQPAPLQGLVHRAVPAPVLDRQAQLDQRFHRPIRAQQRVPIIHDVLIACCDGIKGLPSGVDGGVYEVAALKVLYLVIRDRQPNRRNPTGRSHNWKQAGNTLAGYYDDRVTDHQ